MKDTGIKG